MVQGKTNGQRGSGRNKPNVGGSVPFPFVLDIWPERVPAYYPDARLEMITNDTLEGKRQCVRKLIQVPIVVS